MSANPEYLYATAGGIAFTGGFVSNGGFPPQGLQVIVATISLVILASVLGATPVRPLVSAFGWLAVLAAVYATVPALQKARTTKGK